MPPPGLPIHRMWEAQYGKQMNTLDLVFVLSTVVFNLLIAAIFIA